MRMSYAELFKRAVLIVVVALVPFLIWYLFDVILVAFGAIILAMVLRLGAEPFSRWLAIPRSVALIASSLIALAVAGGAGYLFGTLISRELQDVLNRASAAEQIIQAKMHGSELGELFLSRMTQENFSITGIIEKFFTVSTGFLGALLVMVISAIYLAAQPELYRLGLIKLFPPRLHAQAAKKIDHIGNTLRLWLIGQLIQMILIGVLSGLAAWIIGLPSAIALGLIAFAAEFVPYLGPIIAAVPAVLVAATIDTTAMLWTIAAYLIIHQIEGNLFTPLIQRRLVLVPPAVMLLGIVAISLLFGPPAVIFAAPIVVVVFIAVKVLYVRDTLGEDTEIPGESS
jgi:predicted PurR-regulated permease PerM